MAESSIKECETTGTNPFGEKYFMVAAYYIMSLLMRTVDSMVVTAFFSKLRFAVPVVLERGHAITYLAVNEIIPQ